MTTTTKSGEEDQHELFKFMSQISQEMASEYARIHARAHEDPGTAGDEGEENWAELLRGWLPATYQIETKGRLLGHDGTRTPQVDILVLKPSYPRRLLKKKVFLAGGVAAAFECKATLTAADVTKTLQNSAMIKSLFPPRQGSPYRELRSPIVYGLLAHSHSWKAARSSPLLNIANALIRADQTHVTHPRLGLDVLCVADLATWSSFTMSYNGPLFPVWVPPPGYSDGYISTIYFEASEEFQGEPQRDFTPIGVLLYNLMVKLAWEDAGCRDMASYYALSKLSGAGTGLSRPWGFDTYSDEVRARMTRGQFSSQGRWDEWGLAIS